LIGTDWTEWLVLLFLVVLLAPEVLLLLQSQVVQTVLVLLDFVLQIGLALLDAMQLLLHIVVALSGFGELVKIVRVSGVIVDGRRVEAMEAAVVVEVGLVGAHGVLVEFVQVDAHGVGFEHWSLLNVVLLLEHLAGLGSADWFCLALTGGSDWTELVAHLCLGLLLVCSGESLIRAVFLPQLLLGSGDVSLSPLAVPGRGKRLVEQASLGLIAQTGDMPIPASHSAP
jgi:hypothetical protein